jgi:anti-anti-sigma regulatory factor
MNSEQIDLFVEESGHEVYIRISGTFGFTQFAPLREKVNRIMDGPGKVWFLDVDNARFTDKEYLKLFLSFLENAKERDTELVLVFNGEENKKFFSPYAHIFPITGNWKTYRRKGILALIGTIGAYYSKQTGIRLSPFIALVLIIVLVCWFVTLYGIIRGQKEEIQMRDSRLIELEQESERIRSELDYLQSTIGPLKNLGLIVDSTTSTTSKARIRSWTKYLDRLEDRRREK